MAEAVATILVRNMSELEIYHADLISGAEKELQLLKNDLALLKAFLQEEADSPEKEEGRVSLREIKAQIKDVVYEVEDTIDSRLSQATTASKLSKKLFNIKDVSLAKEVKLLREDKVKELLNKVKDYMSSISKTFDPTSRRRRIRSPAERAMRNNKVVGLDDEENTIIDYLIEPNEKHDVISIIGILGLGKTTLARKIYESERISSRFRTRIWVDLSRKFKIRAVLLSILKSFTSQDMSSLNEQELVETVGALLKEKKFLLVVDDVCSSDDWKAAMQPILPRSNGMGKVLITSRENHVDDGKTHKLRFLRQEESWELLQLQVFGNSGGCPKELEEVGKSIAAQCQLPLQIVAVGRVLSDQLKEKEWRKVSKNGDLFINRQNGMLNLVELSYSGLPDELRECFLYMGVFPEDHEISVWTLIRLWIAEGFVQPIKEKTLEEIAAENLDHLISRNLVMADKVNFDGEVKTCRLHDMIREFCLAKSMEQNFFHEIKDSGVVELREKQNPRRLFAHQHPSNFLSGNIINGIRTRSLLCFYDQPVELKLEHIPKGFPRLRILESNSIKLKELPANLTRLIHLRYLTLYIDGLKILPKSLSRLWNLRTLVVETKSASIEMKGNIWKMIQLRHLKTDAAISLSSKREGVTVAGEKLQTLDKLSPESCTADFVKRACNLKTLGIRGKLDTHSGNMFLEKLTSLEKLKLVNDLCDKIASKNMLAGVLEPKCLPPYLKRLTLSNTFLEWEHMSTLARIKSLEVLKLKCNAFIGTDWTVPDDCFPNLQFLLIAGTNLVQWEASYNCFLSLKCLVLKDCEKLIEIPKALAKTLEVLDIVYVSKSTVDSARKIEQEKKKVLGPFKLSVGLGC